MSALLLHLLLKDVIGFSCLVWNRSTFMNCQTQQLQLQNKKIHLLLHFIFAKLIPLPIWYRYKIYPID